MDYAGRESLIVRYDGRHWFSAEKIEPLPLAESWINAPGEYRLENPDPEGSPQNISLSRQDDVLVFNYELPVWFGGKGKLYLMPISETEAITLGIGRNSGETMRIVDGDNDNGLYFGGYKMRRLR